MPDDLLDIATALVIAAALVLSISEWFDIPLF